MISYTMVYCFRFVYLFNVLVNIQFFFALSLVIFFIEKRIYLNGKLILDTFWIFDWLVYTWINEYTFFTKMVFAGLHISDFLQGLCPYKIYYWNWKHRNLERNLIQDIKYWQEWSREQNQSLFINFPDWG